MKKEKKGLSSEDLAKKYENGEVDLTKVAKKMLKPKPKLKEKPNK
ncbi:MAG: hypothetical protein WC716_02355 [Chitinophagaceae bacterium]|jgi:ribosome-binding protein aMBF1 (putative translation factor)